MLCLWVESDLEASEHLANHQRNLDRDEAEAERQEVLMCFRIAYLADSEVNWCPALATVLSNEEVNDGKYVETGDPVEKRNMKQWMFKIPQYAERLLAGLDDVVIYVYYTDFTVF